MSWMFGRKLNNGSKRKVAEIKYSAKSISDLSSIADYTLEKWGLQQSRKYRDGLNDTFKALLKDKGLGRIASEIYPELRRFPFESHVIFYVSTNAGILIVRVLGQSMDFERHL